MAGGARKSADHILLEALAAGATVATAAERAGVSQATAFRRLQNPAFRQQLDSLRASCIDRASSALAAASVGAAGVLIELATRAKSEFVRFSAARAIIELARDTELQRQVFTLQERITELERRQWPA